MNFPTIPPINHKARTSAKQRQDSLTKPLGSMGRLESLSIDLAGMTGQTVPDLSQKAVILMAADHGIAKEGVSPYPPEVTPQMVLNFLQQGAAINVLTHLANSRVTIVDIGVNYDFRGMDGILHKKIARGTANILTGPAMTAAQAEASLKVGMEVANKLIDQGIQLIATGEMGIGNTTPSAAITAVLTGQPPLAVTGRGTGVNDAGLARKVALIERAIAVNQPDPNDPLGVLCKIGGLEIGGMAGATIAAASRRVPVVLDGLISTAAAAIAVGLVPDVKNYLIAGHQSEEIGHAVLLNQLGLSPLLRLDMRVGEGTGAALAFQLVEASIRILRDMATFGQAGVSQQNG